MNTDVLSIAPELPAMERYGACIDLLGRLRGFVGCVRDTLELVIDTHEEGLEPRLWVVDYIDSEILRIVQALQEIGPGIAAVMCLPVVEVEVELKPTAPAAVPDVTAVPDAAAVPKAAAPPNAPEPGGPRRRR